MKKEKEKPVEISFVIAHTQHTTHSTYIDHE